MSFNIRYSQLFEYPIVEKTKRLSSLSSFYHNHVHNYFDVTPFEDGFEDVFVNYIVKFNFDERRIWHLFYVTYQNKIAMLCVSAGREGDDHFKTLIVDKDAYHSMMTSFIESSIYDSNVEKLVELITLDAEISRATNLDLNEFVRSSLIYYNGYSINDCFDFDFC